MTTRVRQIYEALQCADPAVVVALTKADYDMVQVEARVDGVPLEDPGKAPKNTICGVPVIVTKCWYSYVAFDTYEGPVRLML